MELDSGLFCGLVRNPILHQLFHMGFIAAPPGVVIKRIGSPYQKRVSGEVSVSHAKTDNWAEGIRSETHSATNPALRTMDRTAEFMQYLDSGCLSIGAEASA